jgi:hypothetical protein
MVLDPNVRVIALDPGGTTGWATWQALIIPGITLGSLKSSQSYHCGHIGGPEHGQELVNFLGHQRVMQTVVVCERFDDRHAGHHVDPVALKYIGAVEVWCKENDVPLHMQMPGTAKAFVKDANLRRLGVYQGKQWKHAMDAYRHLFWYLINGEPKRKDLLAKGWPNA